jgi:hypothetical protein
MLKTGGTGRWTTAIYALTDYLRLNNIRHPLFLGYALRENVAFLTDMNIRPETPVNNDVLDKYYNTWKSRPIYLLESARNEMLAEGTSHFKRLVQGDQKSVRLVKQFNNLENEPVCWVYCAE